MLLFLYYCLKVIICSGVLYGYYWLALRNNRFHQWNRWYLLSSVVLSFGMPLLQIPLPYYPEESTVITYGVQLLSTTDIYFATQKPQPFRLTAEFATFAFYSLVVLGLLFFFFRNLRMIQLLTRKYSSQTVDGVRFYNTAEAGTPFSFFKNIFWNNSIDPQSEKGRQMLLHEMAHVTEYHSVDKILSQLSLVFAFWNPFLYFIKKELSVVHEFIADQRAADSNKLQYASLLLMKAIGSEQFTLGNPFFHSQLKRRLIMLTTSKNPRFSYIRRLLVLPLAALSLVLFSFKYKEIKQRQKVNETTNQQANNTNVEKQGDDQDTTKKRIIITLDGQYKGEAVISIEPTADKRGIMIKTSSNNLYFLDRQEARQQFAITVTDSGFIAPKGATVALGDFQFQVAKNGAYIKVAPTVDFPGYQYQIDTTMKVLNTKDVEEATGMAAQDWYEALKADANKDAPLVVADGKKLSDAERKNFDASSIKTINQLDYPAETKQYGDAGKNGVLEITTKKPWPGNALFFIDGFEATTEKVAAINPSNIQSMDILKGEAAIARYGEKARNGAILIRLRNTPAWYNENTLFVKDGKEVPLQEMAGLTDKGLLQSYNERPPAVAIEKYGEKGKNGAIEVTTKIARNEVSFDNEVLPNKVKLDTVVMGYKKQPSTAGTSLSQQAPLPALSEVVVTGHPIKNERYEMVFTKVEEPATFPGGQDGWNRYLLRNLQYPDAARKAQTQGTVRVQIIVNEKGNITELKALDNAGKGLAAEAVRLLAKGPKWNPAQQNGRAVTYRFIQPVVFSLP